MGWNVWPKRRRITKKRANTLKSKCRVTVNRATFIYLLRCKSKQIYIVTLRKWFCNAGLEVWTLLKEKYCICPGFAASGCQSKEQGNWDSPKWHRHCQNWCNIFCSSYWGRKVGSGVEQRFRGVRAYFCRQVWLGQITDRIARTWAMYVFGPSHFTERWWWAPDIYQRTVLFINSIGNGSSERSCNTELQSASGCNYNGWAEEEGQRAQELE